MPCLASQHSIIKQCQSKQSTNIYNDDAPAKIEMVIQSTLVISKLKGPSETLRDIRTSTYQMYSIEENTNGTTKFHI